MLNQSVNETREHKDEKIKEWPTCLWKSQIIFHNEASGACLRGAQGCQSTCRCRRVPCVWMCLETQITPQPKQLYWLKIKQGLKCLFLKLVIFCCLPLVLRNLQYMQLKYECSQLYILKNWKPTYIVSVIFLLSTSWLQYLFSTTKKENLKG